MKRLAVAVLAAVSIGAAASPALAHTRYRVVRHGVVYEERVIGPVHHRGRHYRERVVVRTVERPVYVVQHDHRFIPLPVPHAMPLPPPFRHAF